MPIIKLFDKFVCVFFIAFLAIIFSPFQISALPSVNPINCQAGNNTVTYTPKVMEINLDPDIVANGVTQNIRTYMRSINPSVWYNPDTGQNDLGWVDPIDNGKEVVKMMSEVSSNKVNYSIAEIQKSNTFSDIPLISNSTNVKSTMTQDQFFACYNVDNDPSIVFEQVSVINPTNSLSYPENTATVKRSYVGGERLSVACTVNDYTGQQWVLNKITTNGAVSKEYVKRADLGIFSAPLMDCQACANEIDMVALDAKYDICGKASRGEIDEVWIWDPMFGIHSPYFGGIESTLLESKNFGQLTLSHGYIYDNACTSPVPINVANFQRSVYSDVRSGNGGSIHMIGHRMEASINNYLAQRSAYDSISHQYGVDFNLYNRLIPNFGNLPPSYTGLRFSIESIRWRSGVFDVNTAGCGTVHADPLSPGDYQHEQTGNVNSSCYNPATGIGYKMTGILSDSIIGNSKSNYTCQAWGCTADGWLKYWFKQIPQNLGSDKEMLNDWWAYFLDPEKAITKFPNAPACICPVGYDYNQSTQKCDINSCTNPSNSCAIQNQTNKPICDPTSGACIECNTSADCPTSRNLCDSTKSCVKCNGVISGSSCLTCFTADSTKPYYNNTTSACEACPTGSTWNGTSCIPTGCSTGNITCGGATPYCNTKQDICASCLSDANCPTGQNCLNGTCNDCLAPNPAKNIQVTGLGNLPYCASCATKQNAETAFCPVCAANETAQTDPRSGITVCMKNTCGTSGLACSGGTPWCDGSSCKACPSGANFSTLSNSCVYCGTDEQWDNAASKCVTKTCTNGGLTCGGTKPVCDSATNACVQCSVNSDCTSGFCNNKACAACPSGQFKNSGGSCVSCGAGQIWDMNTLSCVTPAACPVTGQICNNQIVPVCGSGFGSCLQCNTDVECQNTNSPSYNPDKQFCQTSTKACVRCPLSNPNFNTLTNTCGPACPSANQIWNGRECIGEGTTKAPNVCFNLDEGQFVPQIPGSLPFLKSSFCNINQPYCSGVGGSVYNNAPITGTVVCKECLDNSSCGASRPLCEAGKCQVCPAATPFFNSTTNSCQACATATPVYDPVSRTCSACPAGQTFDSKQNKCLVPTCTNGLLICPTTSPICTAASTCVECESSAQCGGAKPACQNNVCVNCDIFDPSTGQCVPNGQAPTASSLKWNGANYVAPTCNNGGIKCITGTNLQCDSNTNSCVQCINDAQCTSDKPICNLTSKACEVCPTSTPVFGPVYLFDDEYSDYISNNSISNQANLNLQSIAGITQDKVQYSEPIVHVIYQCTACPSNSVWDGSKCQIANCNTGAINCSASSKVCDPNSGSCVQCLSDSNCSGTTPSCNAGVCRRCPTATPYFDPSTNACGYCPTGLHWYNDSCIADTALNLHGVVVQDADNDKAFSSVTDKPIPNVTIRLMGYDAAGKSISLTQQTDLAGVFKFDDVPAGNYSLIETQPSGFDNSVILNNNIGVLGVTDSVSNIKLLTQPAGEVQFLEKGWGVSGYLYVDSNLNGMKDATEPVLAGEEVTLDGPSTLYKATTDANGFYSFPNLLNGDYNVSETQPVGFNSAAENSLNTLKVNVNSTSLQNVNFGEKLVSIQTGVFMDNDSSNSKTTSDIPVQTATITLDGVDLRGNIIHKTSTTDATGLLTYSNLLIGNYTLTETQPVTATDGPEVNGTISSTVSNDKFANINLTNDASSYYFLENGFEVSGKVFVDINKNIIQELPDYSLPGVTVQLYEKSPISSPYPGVLGTYILTTITDSSGKYKFSNVPNGDYEITEIQPSGYATNNPNVIDITVKDGNQLELNFSEKSGSITGKLFKDVDGNNLFDNDDKLYQNMEIDLIDESNGKTLLIIHTDQFGNFEIQGLIAGKYRLKVPSLGIYKIVEVSPGQDVEGINISSDGLGNTGVGYMEYFIWALSLLSFGFALTPFCWKGDSTNHKVGS